MPNIADMNSRIVRLEKKLEKLTAVDQAFFLDEDAVPAIRLAGLTTAQRTVLGNTFLSSGVTSHFMVYDTEEETFYTWSGTEWV
jgi:50S ribosomal subunit-associated GTPase HflX